MGAPTPVDTLVLSAAGRQDLTRRLDRALDALADLSERMRDGQRGPEELAEHAQLVAQVEELTAVLAKAADVAEVDEDPRIVEIGDEVEVQTEDGEVNTYAVVHPIEARAVDGRIAVTSPLGRALLGARPGERVRVVAPGGTYTCNVRARRRLT